MGFLKKLLKNKKASELTEKIMVAAFSVAASSAVILYLSNVIIESKNADLSGTLNAAERNKIISEDEGTEGLVYTLDGSRYKITKYIGDEENVVIPSTHEGLPVYRIENGAFNSVCDTQHCWTPQVKNVFLGSGIEEIGRLAFEATPLVSISVPDSVKRIEERAFCNCQSLSGFTMPSEISYIGESAFFQCFALTSVTIPGTNPTIERYAFSGCHGLTTVNLSEGVTSLSYGIFGACVSLTNINFPSTLTRIDSEAFFNAFRTYDANVYIPTTVTSIGQYAFSYCIKATLNCQASSKPPGWSNDWNKQCQCQTNWGV